MYCCFQLHIVNNTKKNKEHKKTVPCSFYVLLYSHRIGEQWGVILKTVIFFFPPYFLNFFSLY